jgi:hypothetical protein
VLHPLDDHQQPRILFQDGVSGSGGGRRPVSSRVTAAPARLAVRLVVEVDADDGVVPGVPRGEHPPVGDPP